MTAFSGSSAERLKDKTNTPSFGRAVSALLRTSDGLCGDGGVGGTKVWNVA